jgi:outer membrane protein assembly factor BamB
VAGGREGALAAFSGRDGAILWRIDPNEIAETPGPYNFTTPAPIGDVNADSVIDFVGAYGGNATRLPGKPRDSGFFTVISGADGSIVATYPTPDSAETYCSPVVYRRSDGTPWVILGTGGETAGGAAFRAPVASLLDGTFPEAVERLTPKGRKGVIAPATVVELTGDDEPDIVISTFDGQLVVLDGATGSLVWERQEESEEAYHSAAVARIARDGKVGLLVSRGIGTFPMYRATVHRLYDARDGSLLYRHSDPVLSAGAPLAADLTDDGIDELIFFAYPGRIYIYYPLSKNLVTHDLGANFSGTPVIADPRRTGSLELIGVAWQVLPHEGEAAVAGDVMSRLLRLNLNAPTPEFMAWGSYMGTHNDGQYGRSGVGSGR